MCVADTPSPSHTRGNGRPKSPPEPAEHGPESLSSCSKWDQPCETFPVYAGKFISTTLLFWWWQIQRRHSSVLPLILQGHQPPHSWCWTMALLYYPRVALDKALHRQHSYSFTLVRMDQRAACTSWNCPLKKAISYDNSHQGRHSNSDASPKR